MTQLLDKAVEMARELPPDMQDEIARLTLGLAGHEQVLAELSDEDEAAVLASRVAASQGAFGADEHMRAIWAEYGL